MQKKGSKSLLSPTNILSCMKVNEKIMNCDDSQAIYAEEASTIEMIKNTIRYIYI